jgi:hypothetical protein
MKHYNDTIISKKRRVAASLIIFLTAGLSLTYALVKANFTHDKKDVQQFIVILPSNDSLFLSGDVPTNTMARYTVVAGKQSTTDSTLVTSSNHFDKRIKAPQKAAFTVIVTWKDLGNVNIVYSYSRFFPLPKTVDKKSVTTPK